MTDPLGLISSTSPASRAQALGKLADAQKAGQNPGPSFKDHLLDELRQANQLGQEATRAAEDLQTGKTTDFDSVFIAQRKAETAFQMLLQVRNKVMDAYNEVKQIRV